MQQVPAQQSVTSLARYAPARANGVDPFHGYQNRDYCNAFWGPGDTGPNVLLARMRGAERTMDELRSFWRERTNIETEYAQKLAKLSKVPIGVEEVGELRSSLNMLQKETEVQAGSHLELADRMRNVLEKQADEFHQKQVQHRLTLQANIGKKLKHRQTQETFATRAWEKCENDRSRINSYTQQLNYTAAGPDAQRLESKLARTRETAKANEKDFLAFTQTVVELLAEWQTEWKSFCDSCHDLEEERMEFMKDNLWLYANEVSTLCVSDDQSCERIRESLDQFEPERDALTFAEEYASGNELPQPPNMSIDSSDPSIASKTQYANFERKSNRPPRPLSYPYQEGEAVENSIDTSRGPTAQADGMHISGPESLTQSPPPPPPPISTSNSNSTAFTAPTSIARTPSSASPTSGRITRTPSLRPGTHLPVQPANGHTTQEESAFGRKVLFYVRALYDYQATIDEEFDFQAGDVIAVTSAPEDGWWSGELLDDARKVEGKHIFPSNFVCLF
ncbi:hypothetical protein AGABI1DRAFT_112889 [Agaricus bisporus var. burnettii JB137-S8]|nr:hypothetical protein AGABI2DRAFT_192858 [Agaricus bisporus var. bisporus H97]XP_007328670.1 uncharacterized protein AGABI1DRAFT_112889 [Agaricus bisporus var. burnettii JB137-S8]EKM81202.1 hypothetical protein AGABI1DRAFT_112889 [Agaricus bisporus var. burnettii JB137-S8]EKV47683.1 hypothetical protein AGABI2DRAFT_192858 [Agaricus bisporus var. bisporus H97]